MNRKPGNSCSNARVLHIDAGVPDPVIIREAAEIVRSGGIVVYPTRNLYGLGGDAFSRPAVEQVFRIKQRPLHKPVSLLIESRSILDRLAARIPRLAEKWMDRFWPGHLTIVFQAKDDVPVHLTAHTGKIGLRIPEHPAARSLVGALGHPITGTSANLAGSPGCHRIDDLDLRIRSRVRLIIDAGPLPEGAGSTVVDVTTDPPVLIREGTISRKILFNF